MYAAKFQRGGRFGGLRMSLDGPKQPKRAIFRVKKGLQANKHVRKQLSN